MKECRCQLIEAKSKQVAPGKSQAFFRRCWSEVRQIIDSDYFPEGSRIVGARGDRFEFRRAVPFILLHLGCLGVTWVGWSPVAVGVAVALYVVRMFAMTGFYHRYFSHRTFRTSRAWQFLFAMLGNTAVQRGPLWWASVHRHHHRHSDQEEDVHSPGLMGFVWAHIGWMTSSRNFPTNYDLVRDLAQFPELAFSIASTSLCRRFSGWRCLDLARCWRRWLHPLARPAGRSSCGAFSSARSCLLHGDVVHQFAGAHLWRAAFETTDDSRNNFAARAHHARRRLAQQSSPLHGLGAAGLLLVGDRHHLLRAQDVLLDRA